MFQGVMPKECIEQMVGAVDFGAWGSIYSCCSGSFRIERALLQRWPALVVQANDVSLLTTAMGRYFCGEQTDLTFVGQLAFVEDILVKRPARSRVAAVMTALGMTRFATGQTNAYKARHFEHLVRSFADDLDKAEVRLQRFADATKIAGYHARDWREHAREAIQREAGIVAFVPFIKGGYEKMFSFLDENVRWTPPKYPVYDPAELPSVLDWIDASDVPYFVMTDRLIEDRHPSFCFRVGHGVPHYGYARGAPSSYRQLRPKISRSDPFKYELLEPASLTRDSVVSCVPIPNRYLNFIRDVYLSAGLKHSNGVLNYAVLIDGRLVGGLSYRKPLRNIQGFNNQMKQHLLTEVLADFSLISSCKLSKFVAMLSRSYDLIGPMDRQQLRRTETLCTTAHSNNPVSMKYRGVFELLSRSDDNADNVTKYRLSYAAPPVKQSPQEIYSEWWDRYGGKEVKRHQNRGQESRPEGIEGA